MSGHEAQVSLSRYLTGPSLFGACSGALVMMRLSPQLIAWLGGVAKRVDLAIWRKTLELVLGRAPEPARHGPGTAQTLRWIDHLLALNDALRLYYCIAQEPARVHELSSTRLVTFVPCDDSQLGLRATAVSVAMLLDMLGPRLGNTRFGSFQPLDHGLSERLRERVRAWREWAEANALNVNARWIAREAVARGIPYHREPGSKLLVRLGHGASQRRLNGPYVDRVSSVATHWSNDKWQTSNLFAAHGLPTAGTRLVASFEQALAQAKRFGWPVVVKPRSTDKGVGITINITDEPGLRQAFEHATRFRGGVLVERHVSGYDHRLLVVGGRFVAAALRLPARVEGDGQRTIAELVHALNLARFTGRLPGAYRSEVPVVLDHEALRVLIAQGYAPGDVPAAGATVTLRGNANLSTGGSAEDVTEQVHVDNRALAEQAARLIGLCTAGLDLQTSDISRSWREVGGAILEINAGPGLPVHHSRTSRYTVRKAIVDDLFPAGATGRIPTAGVTGSIGKTTTCRMLSSILKHAGHTVALTGTQGAFLDERQLRKGDLAGGRAALSLLQDPAATACVAELARGGLIRSGLGLDVLDVGSVLNVYDNHVGLDGIETREQMARVKQLVVRHARQLAVLNADDPLCLAMSDGMDPTRVCLVSEAMSPRLTAHLEAGGMVATMRDAERGPLLSLQRGADILGEMPVADIPATWGARFRPAMLNALFAAALAHGLRVPFRHIETGLAAFTSDYASNPGRTNRISGLPFDLWVAWCDGPEACTEMSRLMSRIGGDVIGHLVIYAVGNRPDAFTRASADAVAGAFDRYYCTDMEEDRRGRAFGEVAGLLADSLRKAGVADSAIVVEPSSSAAVKRALAEMPAGGMLVIQTYHPDTVMASVRAMWPDAA